MGEKLLKRHCYQKQTLKKVGKYFKGNAQFTPCDVLIIIGRPTAVYYFFILPVLYFQEMLKSMSARIEKLPTACLLILL
jgi:hypothetical protein